MDATIGIGARWQMAPPAGSPASSRRKVKERSAVREKRTAQNYEVRSNDDRKMSLSHLLSRLSIRAVQQHVVIQPVRNIWMNSPLLIKPSPCLYGAPLKKKRKMDPAQIKAREEKRKRKLEKEIKRLKKYALTEKPIEERQLPLYIQDQREQREREPVEISPQEDEKRALLMKAWSRDRLESHYRDVRRLDQLLYSQSLALSKLREESEELYQAAIQVDETLQNIIIKGPTLTPPITDYDSPDGDYQNTSFKWD